MYQFKKQNLLKFSFTVALLLGFFGAIQYAANSASAQIFRDANDTNELMMTPVINELQEITSSDGNSVNDFGLTVAKDGNTAVVGANQDAVYIFDVLSGIYCQPVQPDLVSWWTGDGNTLDIRSRNDGTLQNGTTYGTGKVGQAYSLDGVDDFVELGDLPQTQNADEITVMAWVKRQNTTESRGGIIGKWDTGTRPDNSFLLYNSENANENKGGFVLQFDDSSFTGLPGTTLIPFDTWTHIAATWRSSDGQMVIYKNGVQDNITTAGVGRTIYYHTAYKAWIGRWNTVDSSLFRWQGLIDEPAIFTRALTPAEIQQIANADGQGKCKPTATVKPSGLVGWWAGDGDAKDVGNTENGTLQNGAGFAIGKVGQSFKLDGVNDYISIPDSPANSVSTAVTIEGWINPTAAPSVLGSILTKYSTPTGNLSYALSLKPDQTLQFAVYGNGSGTIVYGAFSTPTIPLNQYTHVAATFDATTQTMKLFLDGVEVPKTLTATDNVNPIFDGTSEVRIGSLDSFAGGSINQLFEGEIDEISLYNTVLSATEIKSIVDAGLAGSLKTAATNTTPLSGFNFGKGRTPAGVGIETKVGDATLTFTNVTTAGTTQQIPLDKDDLPTLVNGTHTGLVYDISTSAVYTGNVDVCFNLPTFTTSLDFVQLRVMHLENNVWENRTTTSDFATRTLCSNVSSLSPFVIAQLAPSAASATVSGRVLTQKGRGISSAIVHVMDQAGNIRTARTNPFGYYRFENFEVGQTLIFNVYNKRYQFQTQVVNINENISSLNFVAEN